MKGFYYETLCVGLSHYMLTNYWEINPDIDFFNFIKTTTLILNHPDICNQHLSLIDRFSIRLMPAHRKLHVTNGY